MMMQYYRSVIIVKVVGEDTKHHSLHKLRVLPIPMTPRAPVVCSWLGRVSERDAERIIWSDGMQKLAGLPLSVAYMHSLYLGMFPSHLILFFRLTVYIINIIL